ncbi:MAG: hypothetical protein Q9157_003104 [Trypethelium eluteriae]
MDTKEYGSPLYKGNRPNADSSPVEIFRKSGALIFGKKTTTEFTILNSGPNTTNPHHAYRTPGGSSAGSAAAVADFQVPLSCGTQTGGSVIRPASYTGTYAMKPTFNTISSQGIKVVSLELDTFGYFARSMEDLKLITDVFNVTADEPVKDIPLKETKVGFLKTPFWPSAGLGTVVAMEKAANILRDHDVTVEEVKFLNEFDDAKDLKRMFKVILTINARTFLLKEFLRDTTKTKLDPEIRTFVENASSIPCEEIRRAFDCYAGMRPVFEQIAAKYSVLITPSAADEAPLGLGDMGDADFNFVWTGAHMPVINVPAFAGPNGMPVGLSLIARL